MYLLNLPFTTDCEQLRNSVLVRKHQLFSQSVASLSLQKSYCRAFGLFTTHLHPKAVSEWLIMIGENRITWTKLVIKRNTQDSSRKSCEPAGSQCFLCAPWTELTRRPGSGVGLCSEFGSVPVGTRTLVGSGQKTQVWPLGTECRVHSDFETPEDSVVMSVTGVPFGLAFPREEGEGKGMLLSWTGRKQDLYVI